MFPTAFDHRSQQMWREEDQWAVRRGSGNCTTPEYIAKLWNLFLTLTQRSVTFDPQKVFMQLSAEGISVIETSTLTEEGVMQVKNEVRCQPEDRLPCQFVSPESSECWCGLLQACDRLLAARVETKMKGKKVHDVLNRLHLAMPTKRDQKVRSQPTGLVTSLRCVCWWGEWL